MEIAALGLAVERELGDAVASGSATLVATDRRESDRQRRSVTTSLVDGCASRPRPLSGSVRLVVENGGQPVDQDPRRRARATLSSARRPNGTASDRGAGLGLSIVAAIVEAEGGTVDACRPRDRWPVR